MPRVERAELVRGGEQRDIDKRERHRAMDIVAKIAVLALRQHPHPRARPAIGRRRLRAHRQRFDEGVETARILQVPACRSEEHTSELQSLMRISYAVFCMKKKKQ